MTDSLNTITDISRHFLQALYRTARTMACDPVVQKCNSGEKFNHYLNLTGLSADDPVSLKENSNLWTFARTFCVFLRNILYHNIFPTVKYLSKAIDFFIKTTYTYTSAKRGAIR